MSSASSGEGRIPGEHHVQPYSKQTGCPKELEEEISTQMWALLEARGSLKAPSMKFGGHGKPRFSPSIPLNPKPEPDL